MAWILITSLGHEMERSPRPSPSSTCKAVDNIDGCQFRERGRFAPDRKSTKVDPTRCTVLPVRTVHGSFETPVRVLSKNIDYNIHYCFLSVAKSLLL